MRRTCACARSVNHRIVWYFCLFPSQKYSPPISKALPVHRLHLDVGARVTIIRYLFPTHIVFLFYLNPAFLSVWDKKWNMQSLRTWTRVLLLIVTCSYAKLLSFASSLRQPQTSLKFGADTPGLCYMRLGWPMPLRLITCHVLAAFFAKRWTVFAAHGNESY